ncbi:MAG: tandem-95 repeat protein, partial [Hydrogenophaga sp.]|nr:tandem-95 repeat protein [Hydrogenophaga sp.]
GAGDLLNNASDVDGNPLSISGFEVDGTSYTAGQTATIAGVGALTINGYGSYSFAPETKYNGPIPVPTYTVTDGTTTDTSTLTLNIASANDAPVDGNETNTVTEDTTLTVADGSAGDLLNNASDADGDTLSITQFVVNGTTYTAGNAATIAGVGTLTINGNGSYSFAPAANYNGPIPVATYTVSDGNGGTATSTLTLSITAVNDAPVDGDETNTVTEDTTLTVTDGGAGDLLNNASDVDGNPLSISGFEVNGTSYTAGQTATIAGVGTLTINGNGSYSFAPAANYTGPIPVATYTVSDGNGGTDTSTLTLSMSAVNDAPVATDNVKTTVQDVTVGGNVLTENTGDGVDSDVDGDTLAVSGFTVGGTTYTPGQTATIAGVGTITVNGDGSYSFDPVADFVGDTPAIVYTVSDGHGGTDSATLTITVEPLSQTPSIVDDSATTPENTPVTIDVLGNDDPGSEGPLTITEINGTPISAGNPVTLTDPVTGLPIGEVSLNDGGNADPTDDVLVFTPVPGFNGPVDFTYTVEDQLGNPLDGQVSVDVTPVNEPPVATNDSTVTPTNTPVTVNVLGNDADPDGDPLTITQINGSPIIEGGPAVSVPNGTVALVGGQLVFTPTPGYTGNANFQYTIKDPAGVTASATVTVKVGEQNQPPAAQNDTNSVGEDGTLAVNAANGVILNPVGRDTDLNGDTLSVSAVNGAGGDVGQPVIGTYGTLILNPDGSYSYTPTAAAQALGQGQTAQDVFTYTVSDPSGATATATLTITINGANDAPVAEDNSVITAPDTNVSGNLLTDDQNGSAPGGVDRDPDSGDTLQVSGFTVDGLTGVIGTPLVIPNVGSLTVGADGSYVFDPVPGFEGAVPPVVYTISDGHGGTDSATLSLLVDAANDPPQAQNDNVRGQEDQPVTFNPLTNDSDPEGEPLKITEVNGQPIDTTHPVTINDPSTGDPIGVLSINPDGTLTFTPNENYNTTTPIPIRYTIEDPHGETASATIRLVVDPVNDDPVATDNGPVPVTPNTPVSGNVLVDDSDVDGDPLVVTGFTVDTNGDGTPEPFTAGQTATITDGNGKPIGTLVIGTDGTYTFTPANGYEGPVPSATYSISDGNGGTDSAVLSFGDVPAVPPAPAPAPAPAPEPPAPPAPPVDETRPTWPANPPAPQAPVSLPTPEPAALHVLYAVADSHSESGLTSSLLDGGAQAGVALVGEAQAQLPDSLLFANNTHGENIALIRERGRGELQPVRPDLYVQLAVRHQPISTDPSLWVQHAVRASQLESMVRGASLESNNSATPGYSTMIDPFALGAPRPGTADVKVAEVEVKDKAQEVAAKPAPEPVVKPEAVKAEVADKAIEKPRAAVGLRNQLQRFAKDRAISARPITRSTVTS